MPAGSIVVLGPTEDGTPHTAGGNITIPANANLVLQDTSLTIPQGATLTVDTTVSLRVRILNSMETLYPIPHILQIQNLLI